MPKIIESERVGISESISLSDHHKYSEDAAQLSAICDDQSIGFTNKRNEIFIMMQMIWVDA